MKNILILAIILFLTSCDVKQKEIEKIEFTAPYKFNSEIEYQITADSSSGHGHHGDNFQHIAYDYGLKGDYKNALRMWDYGIESFEKKFTKRQVDSLKKTYRPISATEYIFQRATENQVIIINEAHHNSKHRAFTKSLLQNLFDQGYKNLGLEALSNGQYKDSLLNKRGYPILSSGYYIWDPQFGDLVRTALKIGYNVFPYEVITQADGKVREIEQAKHIQKIINENPNEKFLIHCGFAHVNEGNYDSWGKAMAGRLKEFTKINPLTINQTQFSERSKRDFDNPFLEVFKVKEPSILMNKLNNSPLGYKNKESWTDIAIFHPNTSYLNGRPDWLFDIGNKAVKLDLDNIDISFPVMVLAYKKGEEIKTGIPMDMVEVENKSDLINLALRVGEYEIVVINESGQARKFQLYSE
ncbi:hypothetical protein [Maribacter litoralis]|uniref:hypothetical protein n=1 Tax=Maribacter litoralis TaxID=2059726 RepID=UPI0013DE93D0|nr:hypothetical protein [Maribacter litoralis]